MKLKRERNVLLLRATSFHTLLGDLFLPFMQHRQSKFITGQHQSSRLQTIAFDKTIKTKMFETFEVYRRNRATKSHKRNKTIKHWMCLNVSRICCTWFHVTINILWLCFLISTHTHSFSKAIYYRFFSLLTKRLFFFFCFKGSDWFENGMFVVPTMAISSVNSNLHSHKSEMDRHFIDGTFLLEVFQTLTTSYIVALIW